MALVEKSEDRLPKANPLERPDYLDADLFALRAVSHGNASAEQQRRAMAFLINEVCGTYDMPYRPSGPHDTAFACGKQWVGQTIVWFLNSAPSRSNPADVDAQRSIEASLGEHAP